jgi:regulator of sigma E protease
MTTVLAFLVTLAVLIVVHEYGHYRVAVACNVKVLRFSIGFGRVLWQRRRGETEFVLSALPLGGYVSMLDEREAPVAPNEVHRAFNRKPLWQRAAVVSAGPLANLVLAVLLYAAAHWIGIDEPKAVLGAPVAGSLADQAGQRSGDWVRAYADDQGEWVELDSLSDLRWQLMRHAMDVRPITLSVTDAAGRGARQLSLPLDQLGGAELDAAALRRIGIGSALGEPVMGRIVPAGPAQQAGLQEGDRVLRVDDVPVADAAAVRERVRSAFRDGQPVAMQWQVQRGGRELTLEVKPRAVTEGGTTMGRIDAVVGTPPAMVTVRHGVVDGLWLGAKRSMEVSWLSLRMLGRMLIGEVSLRNLSGPLTIADYAGQSAQQGLTYYLGFLAMVSVSLFVLNLLPLPMLDGGHLMYYLFEGLTGRPVSEVWLARLQRGGVAILLLMMSVALFNDVARLLGHH